MRKGLSCPKVYSPGTNSAYSTASSESCSVSAWSALTTNAESWLTVSEIVAVGLTAKPHSGKSPNRVPTRSTRNSLVPLPPGETHE